MRLQIVSLFGYALMVVALVVLISLRSFFGSTSATIAVQVAALGLMLWARVVFGRRSFHLAKPTEGGLMTKGPYRWIRHPIYASGLLLVGAGLAAHPSVVAALWATVFVAGVAIRIFCEERVVSQKYPEYSEYAARTKRLIPFVF